jgi:hypothetical protein
MILKLPLTMYKMHYLIRLGLDDQRKRQLILAGTHMLLKSTTT